MGLLGARLNGAGMGHFVLQGVGPARGADGHARIVIESVSVQHVEHGVASDGQERRSHALDVSRIDSGVPNQHLGLPDDLVGPFLLVEVGAVAVSDGVRGDFVAVGVKVLDLGVVSPFVRDVKGGLDGASVGVVPLLEELLEELLVEVVDGVVEGQEDELGDILRGKTAGDVVAAAVTIR